MLDICLTGSKQYSVYFVHQAILCQVSNSGYWAHDAVNNCLCTKWFFFYNENTQSRKYYYGWIKYL